MKLEEKQLRKIRHFGVNLYGLLRAKYIHADRERVTFLIEEPLPDCKMVMLSATVCRELYQKVYPNRAIDFHECPKAEYRGHISQYTDSSYSRYAFQNDYDKIRLLKELCRDTTVITFKDIEKRVHHTLSFRQCGGHQCTERKRSVCCGPAQSGRGGVWSVCDACRGKSGKSAYVPAENHLSEQVIFSQHLQGRNAPDGADLAAVLPTGTGSGTCKTAAGELPGICLCRIPGGTGEIYRPLVCPKTE